MAATTMRDLKEAEAALKEEARQKLLMGRTAESVMLEYGFTQWTINALCREVRGSHANLSEARRAYWERALAQVKELEG